MLITTVLSEEIDYSDPVAIYQHFADTPWSFFLDSANHTMQPDQHNRYSYIVVDPFAQLQCKNSRMVFNGNVSHCTDPLAFLQQHLQAFTLTVAADLPPFQGGAVGYLAYDLCRYLEKIPYSQQDDLQFDDIAMGFFDLVISFDHQQQRAWIISSGYPETTYLRQQARAAQRLQWLRNLLAQHRQHPYSSSAGSLLTSPITSNFSKTAYLQAITRIIDYIRQGDVFQVNLAQRFQANCAMSQSFALYQQLRHINAAPFAAYLALDNAILASSSPERFLQLHQGKASTYPIKGTAARHTDPMIDQQQALLLQHSEKDRAENIMIVDLMRNDLSKVCQDHSVQVLELCRLHSFATVHHLISVITGQLRPSFSAIDLLRASLPGGSITGAPKVRAMEIIAELEPHQRGPYCGNIGYLGFDGSLDLSIVIRTFAIKKNTLTFHAGGAIILNSDPEAEYTETLNKAQALASACRESQCV